MIKHLRFCKIFRILHKICVLKKFILRSLAEMVGWYPGFDQKEKREAKKGIPDLTPSPPLRGQPAQLAYRPGDPGPARELRADEPRLLRLEGDLSGLRRLSGTYDRKGGRYLPKKYFFGAIFRKNFANFCNSKLYFDSF